MFTKSMDGRGEAILLHADFTFVSEQSPARPGEVLILYISGLGPVTPPLPAGAPPGDGGDGPNSRKQARYATLKYRPA